MAMYGRATLVAITVCGAVSLSVSFSSLLDATDPRFTRGGAAVSIALSRGATKDTHSKLAQLNKTYFKLFIWK